MNTSLQHLPRRRRFRPVLPEHLIEQDDLRGGLLDLRRFRVVRTLGRGHQQAEHQSGHRRDEAASELHDVLRVAVEMVGLQVLAQQRPGGGGRQHGRKHRQSKQERAHGAFSPLALCGVETRR
jgi:hypothetical protein